MKERCIILSLLWGLLWISNDKSLALVQANSVPPSSAPWFGGGDRPSTTSQNAPRRHKKVRRVKKKRHDSKAENTKADTDQGALLGPNTCSVEERSSELTNEVSTDNQEAPQDEYSDKNTVKRRRKVKVKRRRRTVNESAEAEVKPSPEDETKTHDLQEASTSQNDEASKASTDGQFRRKKRRKVKRNQRSEDVAIVKTKAECSEQGTVINDRVNQVGSEKVPNDSLLDTTAMEESKIGTNDNDEMAAIEIPVETIAENSEASPDTKVAQERKTVSTVIEVTVDMGSTSHAISTHEAEVVEPSACTDNATTAEAVDEVEVSKDDDKVEPETDEEDTGKSTMEPKVVSESVHETFEREVARVEDDYVPNLAEFDRSASEDEEEDDENPTDFASGTSIDVPEESGEMPATPIFPENQTNKVNLADEDKTIDTIKDGSEACNEDESKNDQEHPIIQATDAISKSDHSSNGDLAGMAMKDSQTEVNPTADIRAESIEIGDNLAEKSTTGGASPCNVGAEEENILDNQNITEEQLRSLEDEGATTFQQVSLSDNAVREVVDLSHIDSSEDDDSDLTVSVVTWNLAEELVPEKDAKFIKKFRDSPSVGVKGNKSFRKGSDIVLISGQECENTKPRRAEGHRSREYRRLMIKMLGRKYIPLAIHSLGGVQFGLFCKRSILGDVESVSVADVACGIGNVFHNKGAIAAFVKMKARERTSKPADSKSASRAKSIRMLFVTAHMAAHVKNTEARNMDYWRIASELEDQAPARFLPPRPVSNFHPEQDVDPEKGSGSHLMDSVDRVFFCGDLNYRVDLPREMAESTLKEMQRIGSEAAANGDSCSEVDALRDKLLLHDQLLQTMSDGSAFPGFAEGKITFPPTFKFDKDTKEYDTSHKQRIPAWTDRVLFKPLGVRILQYDSVKDATHSDHRPVFAQFRVNMEGRELPQRKEGRRRRNKRDKE